MEHHQGFTAKHFHELAQKRDGSNIDSTGNRLALQQAGWSARRHAAVRIGRRRLRRPMAGSRIVDFPPPGTEADTTKWAA